MMGTRKGLIGNVLLSFVFVLAACAPRPAAAYVMPAEQVLGLMGANFKNMRSLRIQQSVEICPLDPSGACGVVDETLWLKAPSFFRAHFLRLRQARVQAPSGGISSAQPTRGADTVQRSHPFWDRRFYVLLLPNAVPAHLEFLKRLGVDVEQVGFTRFERRIAYRVGRRGEQEAKLVVEKKRFLPLCLEFPAGPPGAGGMIRVEFTEYRDTPQGWFPYGISYRQGERRRATYRISDLLVRVPAPEPMRNLLTAPVALPEGQAEPPRDTPPAGGEAEDRLKRIIRELQEKYQ